MRRQVTDSGPELKRQKRRARRDHPDSLASLPVASLWARLGPPAFPSTAALVVALVVAMVGL